MRVPLSWLAEHVEIDLSPEALAERLTLLGMEVKAIERRGSEWRNVVVGELLAVDRHPRADRLSLTRVTVGNGEPLEIVCGATNIAAGQRIPVALPGAVLPGDRRIERTEKMGVVSHGMLCSGDELGLTGDGDGILILPSDAPLGVPLEDLYGDVVLDVDVKPNRGDALSIVGLAREVSAVTGAPLQWPPTEVEEAGDPIADHLAVEILDPELCTRFVGRRVTGVDVRPSPDRVQMRLLAAGMRPVSNVVDASNYVMLELGKPIHTFDAAAVGDGRIVVRRARAGERIETLDHVDRELADDTLLIADPAGPLAIAGVMGGAASEVSAATHDVVIESAIFDPVSIRRSAFRYALRSEASLRFEKGQESRLARIGADRTARLIVDWAGGTVDRGRIDTAPVEPQRHRVAFRPARADRLLGTSLAAAEQRALLARVGIETESPDAAVPVPVAAGTRPLAVPSAQAETLIALVPTWRRDIVVEADVIEEIARVHGYDRIPSILPDTAMPAWRPSPLETRDRVREVLVGAGLTESVTHALVDRAMLDVFVRPGSDAAAAGEARRDGTPIEATNPLSADHAWLRQTLLGSLADAVAANARRGTADVALFEVGKGYGRVDARPHEWWRLGIALAGSFDAASWNRPARSADIEDAKGVVELLAASLGGGRPRYERVVDDPILHPGRAARVSAVDAQGEVVIAGELGELHPRLVEERDLHVERLVVAELSIRGLSGAPLRVVRSVPPSRYPDVERDLAVVVGEGVTGAEVEDAIRSGGGPLLRDVRLFDVYRGTPLEPTERSLAFRLTFGSSERTLTEDEVESAVAATIGALERQIGARIRS